MSKHREYLNRWRTDYDFKTFVNAGGSFVITAAFALYNGYLGIHHLSLWYGSICAYYIILMIIRGLILASERRLRKSDKANERRIVINIIASSLLFLLNASLVVPFSIMVRQQKPVNLTLIPAIVMAVYTTYKVIMASIHLKRRGKSTANSLVKLLRAINFIDALVSVITLQNTLIMVNGALDKSMLILTSITSGAIWLAIMVLSAIALITGIKIKKVRQDEI